VCSLAPRQSQLTHYGHYRIAAIAVHSYLAAPSPTTTNGAQQAGVCVARIGAVAHVRQAWHAALSQRDPANAQAPLGHFLQTPNLCL